MDAFIIGHFLTNYLECDDLGKYSSERYIRKRHRKAVEQVLGSY